MENQRDASMSPNETPVASSSGPGTIPSARVGVLQYLGRSGRGSRFGDVITERRSLAWAQ